MTPELGDFQTNISLARRICKVLKGLNVNPDLIIEPTCGEGNFINASLENFPSAKKIVGIELQKHYVNQAKENFPKKSNFKRYNGLDAITGKANFDISEYILLHLLREFKDVKGTLAFLCKTQV